MKLIEVNENDVLKINGNTFKIWKDDKQTKSKDLTFHEITYTLLAVDVE